MITAMPIQPRRSGTSPQISQPQSRPQNMKLYSKGATVDEGAIR